MLPPRRFTNKNGNYRETKDAKIWDKNIRNIKEGQDNMIPAKDKEFSATDFTDTLKITLKSPVTPKSTPEAMGKLI